MRKRYVSLNQCTTLRDPISPARQIDPPTRTAVRRRRLHRGAGRFHRDVQNDGRRFHRVFLFALTVIDLDVEVAQGAMRHLFKQLRDTHAGLRYMWWAEFQRRGAIHFHGMLVEPGFDLEVQASEWFKKHWPLATIRPWARQKSAAWFRDRGADYVMKDVNKGSRKGYQQLYETMPLYWKTFSTHRLACSPQEHAKHEDKGHIEMQSVETDSLGSARSAPFLTTVARHIPARGGCWLPRRVLKPRCGVARNIVWDQKRPIVVGSSP